MNDLIQEFVDQNSIDALANMIQAAKDEDAASYAVNVSKVFNAESTFQKISEKDAEVENKLVSSFHNNLVLLIQKTWVEKSDEALKAQVLYHLDELCHQLNAHSYTLSYSLFFSIVDDVVYLMFGNQAKAKDFDEYAVRIDPEFGIFWWYIKSLPRDVRWSEAKSRIAILLGMYFLANY